MSKIMLRQVIFPVMLLVCITVSKFEFAEAEEMENSIQVSRNSQFTIWGIRYQIRDVSKAVEFYTQYLGFSLEYQKLPAFANVKNGALSVLLSGPGSSGARPMPDGTSQEPGGWNRIVLRVHDLPAEIEKLKNAGVRFRNTMETGPGGRQIQIEDPDGNPIELFEPAPSDKEAK